MLVVLAVAGGVSSASARHVRMQSPSSARASAHPFICHGTARAPGRLIGTYRRNVSVAGTCKVDAGAVRVNGSLTIGPRGVLLADYALNHSGQGVSSLSVSGSVDVKRGATLILGCSFDSPCRDDKLGTLLSRARIGRDLTAVQPLSVIVHSAVIGGSVRETGGGGGLACRYSGAYFSLTREPVFSDYEDSTIRGALSVSNVVSCWLGLARLDVSKSVVLSHNRLGDGDAIEILGNRIHGGLTCTANSHTWDSSEDTPGNTGGAFPRKPEPNTVFGKRGGQCVLASPTSPGGPSGPGPF